MKNLLFLILITLFLGACKKDKASFLSCTTCEDCGTVPHQFSTDVLPIFQNNCAFSGCHDDGTSSAGFAWTNHANIAQPDRLQKILGAIKHETTPTMPLPAGTKLPDSLIHTIECWINDGYKND